jgi:hypothetical protein
LPNTCDEEIVTYVHAVEFDEAIAVEQLDVDWLGTERSEVVLLEVRERAE